MFAVWVAWVLWGTVWVSVMLADWCGIAACSPAFRQPRARHADSPAPCCPAPPRTFISFGRSTVWEIPRNRAEGAGSLLLELLGQTALKFRICPKLDCIERFVVVLHQSKLTGDKLSQLDQMTWFPTTPFFPRPPYGLRRGPHIRREPLSSGELLFRPFHIIRREPLFISRP